MTKNKWEYDNQFDWILKKQGKSIVSDYCDGTQLVQPD